jgi:hypothetical protein
LLSDEVEDVWEELVVFTLVKEEDDDTVGSWLLTSDFSWVEGFVPSPTLLVSTDTISLEVSGSWLSGVVGKVGRKKFVET